MLSTIVLRIVLLVMHLVGLEFVLVMVRKTTRSSDASLRCGPGRIRCVALLLRRVWKEVIHHGKEVCGVEEPHGRSMPRVYGGFFWFQMVAAAAGFSPSLLGGEWVCRKESFMRDPLACDLVHSEGPS